MVEFSRYIRRKIHGELYSLGASDPCENCESPTRLSFRSSRPIREEDYQGLSDRISTIVGSNVIGIHPDIERIREIRVRNGLDKSNYLDDFESHVVEIARKRIQITLAGDDQVEVVINCPCRLLGLEEDLETVAEMSILPEHYHIYPPPFPVSRN